MGVSISFISATPKELDRAESDPSWAGEFIVELYCGDLDRPHGGPEKAWAGVQFLLDGADMQLEFLMDGDPIKEDGTLFNWSPKQVQAVARELKATPWERLAVHYDPERMTKEEVYPNMWRFNPEGELAWLEDSYKELVEFFDAAAKGGYGAFMNFSF